MPSPINKTALFQATVFYLLSEQLLKEVGEIWQPRAKYLFEFMVDRGYANWSDCWDRDAKQMERTLLSVCPYTDDSTGKRAASILSELMSAAVNVVTEVTA